MPILETVSKDIHVRCAVPGYVEGQITLFHEESLINRSERGTPDDEYARFQNALNKAMTELRSEQKYLHSREDLGRHSKDAIDILETHLLTLEDPFLLNEIKQRIFSGGATAAASVVAVINAFGRKLGHEPDPVFKHIPNDIADIKKRILSYLGHERRLVLPNGVNVIYAEQISGSQIMRLKQAGIEAVVLADISLSSHEFILLRALKVPCVYGIKFDKSMLSAPRKVIVDADSGHLILDPENLEKRKRTHKSLGVSSRPKAKHTLASGELIKLKLNLNLTDELQYLEKGISGIGLYRTEYMVLEKGMLPSEKFQTHIYKELMLNCGKNPAIIRLFDFAPDKNFLHRLELKDSKTMRSVRFLLANRDILHLQARAILKAGKETGKKPCVLIPFLNAFEEFLQIRDIFLEAASEIKTALPSFGVMIETAAAVELMPDWEKVSDFFSIGTNDLLQNITATDRNETMFKHFINPLHKSFISILIRIRKSTHKEVTICGEAAGDPDLIPLLVGAGYRSFSVAADRLGICTQTFSHLRLGHAKTLLKKVNATPLLRERESLVRNFSAKLFSL